MNILQYEPKIWETADLLRGSGIKESEWPSYMMPFFPLAMIESRFRPDSKIEHGYHRVKANTVTNSLITCNNKEA